MTGTLDGACDREANRCRPPGTAARIGLLPLAAVLALCVTTAPMAWAHSLEALEDELQSREKYFQSLDRQAPEFTLRDAEGRAISLTVLRGKVVVLHFIYTGCPDVCPLHTELIAEVQSLVNQTPMKELVQFLSVTTDPENDVPEVMRDYGSARGLDPANWTFLTTKPDQPEDTTRKLATAYRHKFVKTEEGYQIHGLVTHVIDREGRWRGNFHGLKFDPTNLVVFVNALGNEHKDHRRKPKPSLWEKFRRLF